jgi:hypothetical protein
VAKLTNPLNSGEARGSVGTLTYNTWRGMATVKTKGKPPYDPLGLQGDMFHRIRDAAQRWKTITATQRAAWESFSEAHLLQDWSKAAKRISGFNWYVKIQARRQLLAQGYADDPPTREITWGFSALTTSNQEGSILLLWTPNVGSLQSYMRLEIWITPLHSPGRKATLRDARFFNQYPLSQGNIVINLAENGTYTIFARSIDLNGMVAPFQSITFAYVSEEGFLGGGGDE